MTAAQRIFIVVPSDRWVPVYPVVLRAMYQRGSGGVEATRSNGMKPSLLLDKNHHDVKVQKSAKEKADERSSEMAPGSPRAAHL